MKVRIVKSSKPSFWYADRIGEVFEVTLDADGRNYTLASDKVRWIGVEDCEPIDTTHNGRVGLSLIAPSSRAKIGTVEVLVTQVHIESSQVEYTVAWWDSGQRYSERVPEYEITNAEKTMKVGFE